MQTGQAVIGENTTLDVVNDAPENISYHDIARVCEWDLESEEGKKTNTKKHDPV
jgi:hypothetical protein